VAKWKFGECLVTGGAGFLGKHLVKVLLNKYNNIKLKVIARSENEMAALLTICSNDKRLVPIIGDIRDIGTLEYALHGINSVIHLAAMKHIDLCELYPTEAIKTNVIATMNLLHLFEGDVFVSMSTDKASEPRGCYGATKLLIEKVTLEQAQKFPNCRYMVVRSGNFFGSTGSVIPKWIQQIKQENKIVVTDLKMTKFFIDVDTLAVFMIEVIEDGENGKIYIPDQVTLELNDLAKAIVGIYGDAKTKLEVVGLRKGEKMHERLFFASEKNIVAELGVETSEQGEHIETDKVKMWLKQYEGSLI
jgi:FlaA1/EpsC-like NDP-sugar epimerase